jgi:hypothetical protein
VQTPAEMFEGLDERVRSLNRIADGLYERWINGLG